MTLNSAAVLLAVVALAALVWWFRRQRQDDAYAGIVARHGATAKICTRAELVDGRNHIPVTLTLEQEHVYYENPDLNATLDIRSIDEVEYGSELMTGAPAKGSVLRLRSHGRAVEFVLDSAAAAKWAILLPPHRMNELGDVHAV
jgi:hypothetical protein